MKHNVGSIKNIVSHVETAYGFKDGGDGKKEIPFYIPAVILMLIPAALALFDRFVNHNLVEMMMFKRLGELALEGPAYYYGSIAGDIIAVLFTYVFFKGISLALEFSKREKEDKRILRGLKKDLSEKDIVLGRFMSVLTKTVSMNAVIFALSFLFYSVMGPMTTALAWSLVNFLYTIVLMSSVTAITLWAAANQRNKMPWLTAFAIIAGIAVSNFALKLVINPSISSSITSFTMGLTAGNPESIIKLMNFTALTGVSGIINICAALLFYSILAKKAAPQKAAA